MGRRDEIEGWLACAARDIAPGREEVGAAKEGHRLLRSLLDSGEMARRISRSYLSGSYVRHTGTSPLNDVDVVFEVNPDRWRRMRWTLLDDGLPTPEQVITTFSNAIRQRLRAIGDESRVRQQTCSVGVVLDDIHVDLVPAIPLAFQDDDAAIIDDEETEDENEQMWADAGVSSRVLIPNRRRGSWIESAPRAHTRIAASLNAQSQGCFKPSVRLLKTWNDRHGGVVPSFTLETIAGHIFANIRITSLLEAVRAVWDAIVVCGGGEGNVDRDEFSELSLKSGWLSSVSIPDLAGVGDLAESCAKDEVARLVTHASGARDQLDSALRARSSTAVDTRLNRLFGVEDA